MYLPPTGSMKSVEVDEVESTSTPKAYHATSPGLTCNTRLQGGHWDLLLHFMFILVPLLGFRGSYLRKCVSFQALRGKPNGTKCFSYPKRCLHPITPVFLDLLRITCTHFFKKKKPKKVGCLGLMFTKPSTLNPKPALSLGALRGKPNPEPSAL